MIYEEFSKLVGVLNSAFRQKDYVMIKDKAQAMIWYEILSDLDYDVARRAVMNLIAKSKFAPSIAEIRQEYALITNPQQMGEGEAWDMVREGIRNGIYGATEEFEKFPDTVKRAVGSPASLSDWAMMSSADVETVVQGLFKKAYRVECEKENKDAVLGAIGTRAGEMQRLTETVAKLLEGGE